MVRLGGFGSTHYVLVCNRCHAETELGKVVPYQVNCPNGCGLARTTYRFEMLFIRQPESVRVHRMVAISTTSKKYLIYQAWKKQNGKQKAKQEGEQET